MRIISTLLYGTHILAKYSLLVAVSPVIRKQKESEKKFSYVYGTLDMEAIFQD